MTWPKKILRIPAEEWTKTQLEELAMKYDTVEEHGWYDNLIHTTDTLLQTHTKNDLIIDYSGGTGILADRLFRKSSEAPNILIVDSSPKFLRLALEKNKDNPKVGFRLIRYMRDKRRLQFLEEVLDQNFYQRKADGLVSTNAIHLYYQLPDTLRSWKEALRPGARIHIQSGNIRNPEANADAWIIDETVDAIHHAAITLVQEKADYAFLRETIKKTEYMNAHDKLRAKYFLPVRPLSYYLDVFTEAGYTAHKTEHRYIQAQVEQWYEFLVVYHEGVLGWVGGAEKITKEKADPEIVALRKKLIREAMDVIFSQKDLFTTVWTYMNFTI